VLRPGCPSFPLPLPSCPPAFSVIVHPPAVPCFLINNPHLWRLIVPPPALLLARREFLDPLAVSHFNVEGTIEFSAMLFTPGGPPYTHLSCCRLVVCCGGRSLCLSAAAVGILASRGSSLACGWYGARGIWGVAPPLVFPTRFPTPLSVALLSHAACHWVPIPGPTADLTPAVVGMFSGRVWKGCNDYLEGPGRGVLGGSSPPHPEGLRGYLADLGQRAALSRTDPHSIIPRYYKTAQ
jgi:hypothetical protein